ncbi:MAG: M48 family metalloprotease [Bacteroidota bacterium]
MSTSPELLSLYGAVAGDSSLAALTPQNIQALGTYTAGILDDSMMVAPLESEYGKRLDCLTEYHRQEEGLVLNFKAYVSDQVNAFALPDGSVRVYTGLMDLMNDHELAFVIGHEIGHVQMQHTQDQIVQSVLMARGQEAIGDPAKGALGNMVMGGVTAKFSRDDERDSDLYGLEFMFKHGFEASQAPSALRKLAGAHRSQGMLGDLMSTHPNPGERARALEEILAERGHVPAPVEPLCSAEAIAARDGEAQQSDTPGEERDLAWVQGRLNDLGYDCGSVDGLMGPKTRSCLRTFQSNHGLAVTGETNAATVATLERQ